MSGCWCRGNSYQTEHKQLKPTLTWYRPYQRHPVHIWKACAQRLLQGYISSAQKSICLVWSTYFCHSKYWHIFFFSKHQGSSRQCCNSYDQNRRRGWYLLTQLTQLLVRSIDQTIRITPMTFLLLQEDTEIPPLFRHPSMLVACSHQTAERVVKVH